VGDFTPGVERAKKAGYAIEVRPYEGTGEEQVAESLDVIAKKIRDGRLDPDVRGWVGDVLKAAGDPKSRAGKVQAILDAFRQATIYVSDPVGAEYIVAAGTTMCLRPGLCVRARDCDDGCVAVGSAIMAAGIPVVVIKQNFGPGKQEHVLVEALMEDGTWLPADPSTNLAAGDKVPAVSEERIDPMDTVGSSGTSGPEIVTLGAVPAREWPRKIDGVWTVRKHGQWWRDQSGVGWVPVGTGEACCAECAAKDAAKAALAAPPAPKSGTGSEDEGGEGCSACEAWAKRHEAEIAAMGVSGASSSKAIGPKLSLLARLRDGRLGLGADVPGTTVLANPLPIQPTSGSVGVGAVAVVALGLAAIGGVAWSLGRDSACSQGPRGRRRAA
jgi:hypothetical protein